MSEGRPAIPAELRRRVLVEAGHRCAIPTCRRHPVDIEHIDDWAAVREHRFENLIALCPTCHRRKGSGPDQIDRKSLRSRTGTSNPATRMSSTCPPPRTSSSGSLRPGSRSCGGGREPGPWMQRTKRTTTDLVAVDRSGSGYGSGDVPIGGERAVGAGRSLPGHRRSPAVG
ncbi:HNH endonuclease signature motif containing protein [Streptomyces sp. NPDC006197]|uniref:HNH endonuclease n=1 Tax=Streptomyces sp. NPDC006197 TaxID=3156685 RepID=UPI0033B0E878